MDMHQDIEDTLASSSISHGGGPQSPARSAENLLNGHRSKGLMELGRREESSVMDLVGPAAQVFISFTTTRLHLSYCCTIDDFQLLREQPNGHSLNFWPAITVPTLKKLFTKQKKVKYADELRNLDCDASIWIVASSVGCSWSQKSREAPMYCSQNHRFVVAPAPLVLMHNLHK